MAGDYHARADRDPDRDGDRLAARDRADVHGRSGDRVVGTSALCLATSRPLTETADAVTRPTRITVPAAAEIDGHDSLTSAVSQIEPWPPVPYASGLFGGRPVRGRGNRFFAQRSMSDLRQTLRPPASSPTGFGKSSRSAHRCTVRRVVWSISAISATPAKSGGIESESTSVAGRAKCVALWARIIRSGSVSYYATYFLGRKARKEASHGRKSDPARPGWIMGRVQEGRAVLARRPTSTTPGSPTRRLGSSRGSRMTCAATPGTLSSSLGTSTS